MDTMETSIPGAEDSSHRFDAKDYKIIHGLPDSAGFRIKSIKVNETSTDRLIILDQLGKEVEMLDNEHLRGIKGWYPPSNHGSGI